MSGREAHIKACWLVWRNHPMARQSGVQNVKDWVAWLMSESFLLFALDDDDSNSIAGMVVARPLMKSDDSYDYFTFDQEGSCIFIDLAVSKHPEALVALGFAVLSRFGMRQTIAWEREGKMVEYPSVVFRRHLLRRNLIRK